MVPNNSYQMKTDDNHELKVLNIYLIENEHLMNREYDKY